jgi:hypothetical protein
MWAQTLVQGTRPRSPYTPAFVFPLRSAAPPSSASTPFCAALPSGSRPAPPKYPQSPPPLNSYLISATAQVCGSALFCLRRFASAAKAYSAAVRLAAPGTTAGLQDALADCYGR